MYIGHVDGDLNHCVTRNIHKRTVKDITKLQMGWEPTPAHMHKIDLSSFLQAKSIVEVDMIDAEDDEIVIEKEIPKTKDEVTKGVSFAEEEF